MSESRFARSRRASVLGLILQVAAVGVCLALAFLGQMPGLAVLGWLLLGGVPIWFVTLLVQRQKELAELEREDFEELKREKAASGGDALFGTEGAGALGYQVAEQRLQWMLRWLTPIFGLLFGGFLAAVGYVLVRYPGYLTAGAAIPLVGFPIVLTILAVLMLLMFLMSRYAAGLARIPEWQMLRAGGSYAFGNAIAAAALLGCLTADYYAGAPRWETWFVRLVPPVMLLLAAEALLNVVLDIYRPRRAGVEPRTSFDSRLLGLFSEPGGIAASIADAINYQFGFEISRTWFYQLLQRTFVPLLWVGGLALWGLSALVIVAPDEHAIVERWGRQVNAESPWGPGLHFKAPWPVDVAKRYNTGKLHEMLVGYRDPNAQPEPEMPAAGRPDVVLWSQDQHRGQYHFEFIISPQTSDARPTASAAAPIGLDEAMAGEADRSQSVPVNLVRMVASIQFKIAPDKLADYTVQTENPEGTLRNIAWGELVKFSATQSLDSLLGGKAGDYNEAIRQRIAYRVDELKLGLEVVYVGLYNLHPETSVAEAYRNVIDADQQRTNSIREALVSENEVLINAAGDRRRARSFVLALENLRVADRTLSDANAALGQGQGAEVDSILESVRPRFEDLAVAEAELRRAEQEAGAVEQEFAAGIGSNIRQRQRVGQKVEETRQNLARVQSEVDAAIRELRGRSTVGDDVFEAGVRAAQARVKRRLWSEYLARELAGLEGAAAAGLAQAQAERWEIETQEEARVRTVQIEGAAFRANPQVYKIRRYYQTIAEGMSRARKFFLAFDQTGRNVTVRVVAEDQANLDVTEGPLKLEGR